MKQLFAMLRLDMHLIFRDKIIWYVLFFPAIIAIILILVTGRISDTTPTIAIYGDMPQTVRESFEKVANLDWQPNNDSLIQRVNAFDNVIGIRWEGDKVNVVYQGNEGIEYQKQMTSFMNDVLNKEIPEIQIINVNTSRDMIVQIIMAALLLSPALIGGTVSGFLIVAEKENKLFRGYQIAPIRLSSYIGARALLASIIGFMSMILLCAIFQVTDKLGVLILVMLCSLPLFGVITILFGSIAKDKISCIAMFKILVVVFLVLPLASGFVPDRLQNAFYVLPMYWQFQSVLGVLNNNLHLQFCLVTFLSSVLLLALVTFIFRNKIQKI